MENFNQNITNKGWASMETMLEKEMPLQRGRRRRSVLALLLLMLGTCLLTSAGWWIALRKQWIKPVAPVEAVASRYVRTDKPAAAIASNQLSTPVENSLQNQVELSTAAQIQQQNRAERPVHVAYRTSRQGQIPDPLKEASSKSVETTTSFGYTVNPLPSNFTNFNEVVSDVVVPERLPLPFIPVAHNADSDLNTYPTRINVADVAALIKPKNVRPLTFGPTIGLASEQFSTLNGATIGGSVNWHFAKHWGLRSSLLYSYLRPSPDKRPVTSLRAQEYADATGSFNLLDTYGHLIDPQTGMSTATNKVYVPLQRLNRFEAPLMVYGQILKRLRLMAGPTMSYSLSVQADKVYALDRIVSNSVSERNADKVDALAADEVKRWQLGFQTGIGLRLGDRLELDFLYRINSIRTYSRVLYDYDGSLLEYAPQRSAQINNLTIFTLNGIMFF